MAQPMPAVFLGHGSPMNAISDTPYSRAWKALGQALPRPRAILCISAHWFINRTAVTAMPNPPTIHDFYGFPKALHDVHYPAPGDPELASEIAELLTPLAVELDQSWGLDHGTWSVLRHTHPLAEIPVVQLAIDETKPPQFHYDLGRKLAPLRDRGILIVGSGNIVHNLRVLDFDAKSVYEWASRFDEFFRSALEARDHATIINYEKHPDARLAAPTPDHYLPALYIAALQRDSETVQFPVDGIDAGSIAMRSFSFGA